jgi:Zn-dependent M16 (insulinase) family peptidase
MTDMHGFELKREQDIAELKTVARLYRHTKTGAELLSLLNDDENKVFGITFRTPPTDSTGLPHILEHSVLCGSRKYPVKEPFVELLKGSLQTFLNAFTYPDKTCYPVASQNLQDFYNLIDVYLDAVFYPRLTPPVFQQEGWHFELEDPDQPLRYKGVVFNEMKGAYSSPDHVLGQYSFQSLFPDTPYGFDSGGHPRQIPDLTFERFQDFYKKYYHPSNARFYFWGDDDPQRRLRLLKDYLDDFEPRATESFIPLQSAFDSPHRLTRPFVAGDGGGAGSKGMITLNWLLTETRNATSNYALRILAYILVGMPASPLRKALIDSGLGEDLAGEGLGTELRQMYFSTGLKGIDIQNGNRIEALVLETLEGLARKGIDARTVEAALNTIEFRLRESNTSRLPRGLALMLLSLSTWLYDEDPMALLAFEAPLRAIKSNVKQNPLFFEEMIHDLFLTNPHRTTLIFEPDPGLRETEETLEKESLVQAASAMGPDKRRAVLETTRELRHLQETPDPPEALATLPMLRLDDLDKKNKEIPVSVSQRKGTRLLFHELFTNAIAYLDLGFDLRSLPEAYVPYVPLFGRALLEMGTDKEDFVSFTQRINRKTGGIHAQWFTSAVKDASRSAAWLFLRGKAMVPQSGDLVDILGDAILRVQLDNRDRFRQMLFEEKARAEQRLIPSGHLVVNLRLRAPFDAAHWATEQMEGISQLFFLRGLAETVEKDWSKVLAILQHMHRILINQRLALFNITLDGEDWPRFEPHFNGLVDALPEGPVTEAPWSSKGPSRFEGMTVPSQVNYVGKGADIYSLGYRFHGSALVITRYLRTAWLWDRVRVQGGAYGAFCLLDRLSGVLTFVSYRDPNLAKTLDVFDHTGQFLREVPLSKEELTKGIIGAIGDLDAYMLPDAKGYASMLRYLTSDTDVARQRMRDEVLGTQLAHFREFAQVLERVKEKGVVKVLGAPNAVEEVSKAYPGSVDVFPVL